MKIKNLKVNVKSCAILSSVLLVCTNPLSKENISIFNINSNTIKHNKTQNFEFNNNEFLETKFMSIRSNEQLNNEIKEITISFAGDCTLGNDKSSSYFNDMVKNQNNDYSYFFRNVKEIFKNDDYTLVNLESTLTDATKYAEKTFNFKGDFSYVNILLEGDIEGVNIANNHTHDYLEKGYQDTVDTLTKANIDYSGNEYIHVENINGIRVGFIGFSNSNINYENLKDKLDKIKQQKVDLIIASCHWGIERDYQFNSSQQDAAHYLIDNGADVVIGHHPHVLQGIENYNGKYIIYSLGNFCFGGNSNPKDKDSMIIRETFIFKDKQLSNTNIEIIPCSISSVAEYNNFQPTPLNGTEKDRVIEKVKKYSYNFIY